MEIVGLRRSLILKKKIETMNTIKLNNLEYEEKMTHFLPLGKIKCSKKCKIVSENSST